MSKSRIEISHSEMNLLAKNLAGSGQKEIEKLRDKLIKKLLRIPVSNSTLRSVSLSGVRGELSRFETNLLAYIVRGISLLTGKPENSIRLSSRLSELGLSSFKIGQLRVYINQFVKKENGTVFISATDMAGFKTVQELFDFTNTLIP